MRKFPHFNIRNQNVIFIMSNGTFSVLKLNRYACNLHLNKQRDKKIVSDILHRVYLEESTPLNKLAVADAAWARMPVDSLNMTLA